MGNVIGLVLIGIAAGFALFVTYKLIKAGLDDRNRDDKEQKDVIDNHSEDFPSPKNHEK